MSNGTVSRVDTPSSILPLEGEEERTKRRHSDNYNDNYRGSKKHHSGASDPAISNCRQPAVLIDAGHRAASKPWVVYAKPPFGGPTRVLAYLANYTHRIAISNSRILVFDGQSVTFRWRDSADASRQKVMVLPATEFLRRFLLHVLPPRLVRIRYYGFMANRVRAANIARARILTSGQTPPPPSPVPSEPRCPICHGGILQTIGRIDAPLRPPPYEDSS